LSGFFVFKPPLSGFFCGRKMAERKKIDWEAVEREYRAGIRSLKDIGEEFGVSDAGILKRAKRDDWARDLQAKVRAKADALVSAALVSAEVSAEVSANRKIAEREVVEVEAKVQARIRLTHRSDIKALRERAARFANELDECGEELAKRASILKSLADTQKTLIALEREAYNMANAADEDAAIHVRRIELVALTA
jgi:hypothetical protein